MNAMYGKKLGMTRIFTEKGENIAVTILEMTSNVVYQVKTKEHDGYSAVQVGLGTQKQQRVNKALTQHFAKAEKGLPKFVGEIRSEKGDKKNENVSELKLGDEITVDSLFKPGDLVDVVGTSIGKGFAGVIKRHHMKGAQTNSHGTHEYFRHGGSIGNRKTPGRVFKNKKMPGHLGNKRVTQQAIEVLQVRPEEKIMIVKGSVPGSKNGIVFVQTSIKA
ncbi:MAG: 50S ribosomal protein L3 [Deltaproteobacteria bacterium]|jgi:large subunit ribosomal protein L3|nr:50S ribosomal protein L3 [Deltaproteobacteria bacterium]